MAGPAMKSAQKSHFDPARFLAVAGRGKTIARVDRGTVLYAQGDQADSVFYIQDGRVKVTVTSEDGREAVVGLPGSGEFCGEGCLTGQPLRMATAVTLGTCDVMRLNKTAFAQALRDEPAFSAMFVDYLLGRTLRVEEDLVDQLVNSSEKRLARALLLLANFGKEGKADHIIPKISQEILADMIGTTRSRVSFFMNKFRRLGFISYDGDIEVHASLLNVVLHEALHAEGSHEVNGERGVGSSE